MSWLVRWCDPSQQALGVLQVTSMQAQLSEAVKRISSLETSILDTSVRPVRHRITHLEPLIAKLSPCSEPCHLLMRWQPSREQLDQQEGQMQATLERLATVEDKFSAAQAFMYESQVKADADRCCC